MKTNGNAGANKPRARLSPTEIVNLPASDSEPEDLRQNELSTPLPSDAFRDLDELEELDLYDNRLGPRISDEELRGCPNIT